MRSDVLLEVTGLLEAPLTEATLVGSVHTARLPQVLVKQVVSRGLLYQTCIGDEYWFLQWNIGQVSRFVGDSFEGSLLGRSISIFLQLFKVRLNVGFPVCRGTEQLVTLRTLEGLGTCVHSKMDLEAPLSGEQLVAGGAFVILDPSVGLDVGGQRALHCEGSETLGTLVRLLVGVDANVSYEITGFLELFTAVGTLMPPHSIHLSDDMSLHHPRGSVMNCHG